MPGGDRTGPMGAGPMTGRAAGYCAGYPGPGSMNVIGGRGFGGGGGGRGGRGRRNRFYATGLTGWQRTAAGLPAFGGTQFAADPGVSAAVSQEQELSMLKLQAETMQQQMTQLQQRIQELGGEKQA